MKNVASTHKLGYVNFRNYELFDLGSMPNCNACRRRNDPADLLIRLVPFDAVHDSAKSASEVEILGKETYKKYEFLSRCSPPG